MGWRHERATEGGRTEFVSQSELAERLAPVVVQLEIAAAQMMRIEGYASLSGAEDMAGGVVRAGVSAQSLSPGTLRECG